MSNLLKPDTNVEYSIPFASPQKMYIRTGVHGDGSCFHHAFLRITSPQYRYATYDNRCKQVTQLREQLADSVTNETLIELGNGEPRRMLFFELLSARLDAGFPETDVYGPVLNKLVDLPSILKETTTFSGNFYMLFLEKIELIIRNKIGDKYAKFDRYIKSWFYELFMSANETLIQNFKNKLLNDQVSALEIEFISRRLNYNFLFLRDVNGTCERYPLDIPLNKEWPVIVLLWKDDCHYEIIGEMDQNRIVRRMFPCDDSLVQAFMTQ